MLGCGVAGGYLNYFKDAAIASLLAFAINQLYFYGLVLLTKSELCSSNLAVSGEAQRTLFSEACWWKFLCHTVGVSFIFISETFNASPSCCSGKEGLKCGSREGKGQICKATFMYLGEEW